MLGFRLNKKRKAMADLIKGDVFCYDLNNREFGSLEVIDIEGSVIVCKSLNMELTIYRKPMDGYVFFSRNKFKVSKKERRYLRFL